MRPAVLIVDPDGERRRRLSESLAAEGYEAVPADGAEQGLRFAQGLGPSVIVAPASLGGFGDASILDAFAVRDAAMQRTLLLLGDRDEPPAELSDEVLYLRIGGLDAAEISRRIRLVLVGRELEIEPAVELRSLVGDLAYHPFLELVRSLHRCLISGRLSLIGGEVLFTHGEVVAARAGKTRSVKAFCRLSRRREGSFHIFLEPPFGDREMHKSVPDLVLQALEDAQVELPDPRTQVRLVGGEVPPIDGTSENLLLQFVHRSKDVGELIDLLPATDGRVAKTLRKLIERNVVEIERARAAVAVLTDSTADLPPDLAARHDVQVVPLTIRFGDDAFLDGVEIRPRDFYELLASSDEHPATSPPSEGELSEHFHSLLGEQDILALHLSAKLSKTFEHSRAAANEVLGSSTSIGRKVVSLEVVDSGQVSMGLGLMTLFAARMAIRGKSVATLAGLLRRMKARIVTLFVVDTLDYLVRGGRLGKGRAAFGKLFDIKPILGVEDGEVVAVDRVRGGRRAQARLIKLFQDKLQANRPVVAAISHAHAPVWADRLRQLLTQTFDVREVFEGEIGPVVGAHAGPGCVGAVVFQPEEDEWPLIAPLD